MTIEIRELVIQAKLITPENSVSKPLELTTAQSKANEARLIELITQEVLHRLREEGGLYR